MNVLPGVDWYLIDFKYFVTDFQSRRCIWTSDLYAADFCRIHKHNAQGQIENPEYDKGED